MIHKHMTGRQTTIKQAVSTAGIGLHTGAEARLTLRPAPPYTGIVFRRVDLEGFEVPASPRYVAHVSYATALVRKGVMVATVEHLLAALLGCGVDNVIVELDAFEVPIMDGSAAPFVALIHHAGITHLDAPRQYLRILKPVEVTDKGKSMSIRPASQFSIRCTIDFDHPLIGRQERELTVGPNTFSKEVAPARTFGFLHEVEGLRRLGLVRGGSLENAIVLTPDGLLNEEPLRFPDEFVRHKMLDMIGDLALLGRPILGRVEGICAGHAVHNALVAKVLRSPTAWEIIEGKDQEARIKDHEMGTTPFYA
jgi:UDP-3-O-[3-hydroxymyristoyl] N-acetylglucosamine deacetylase